MKKSIYFFLSIFLLSCFSLQAQLTLPQPSPHAHFTQTVGVTTVDIDYSRPGVKNRTIFGGLLPFDSLWRAGANSTTTIEFSEDVKIGGKNLAKGKYAIYAIPSKTQWTVIFNKDFKSSTSSYQQSEDAVRVKVAPKNTGFMESLTINLNNLRDNSADLVLAWENTTVVVPIEFSTVDLTLKNIKKATEAASTAYGRGANYYLENNLDLNTATELIDKALAIDNSWYNNYVKANILAKQGDFAEAADYAEKAVSLGKTSGNSGIYRFYSGAVEKAATDYRSKAGSKKSKKKKK